MVSNRFRAKGVASSTTISVCRFGAARTYEPITTLAVTWLAGSNSALIQGKLPQTQARRSTATT